MKNLLKLFLLLSFCTWKAHSAIPDTQTDFLQSEATGSFLVERETDNKLPMSERINMLFLGSRFGYSNGVARLVEGGVPANSTNSAGETTLMSLARGVRFPANVASDEVGVANYLISHGVKTGAKGKNGKTAADYAFEYGRYKLLPILDVSGKYKSIYEDNEKRSAQNKLAETLGDLVVASMSRGGNLPPESYSKVKIISDALKAGANPDQDLLLQALGGASSEDYWVPMGQIMPEAISELIKGGAKVNEPLSNGLQPLFYAVSKPALFKMLLNAGADPHKASHVAWSDWSDVQNNRSPAPKLKFIKEPIICEAAEFGVAETLQMLLEHGISVEERDSRGNTPLHRAVDFANVEAINFLLKHQASLQATNNEGQNALEMAAARLNVNFVRAYDKTGRYRKILEDYPGDPRSPTVGKWALESARTNLFLKLDPQGGGEVIHNWKKPLAWKVGDKAIEIFVYCPVIPRMPGDESEPGWVEYHSETDTCVLRWRDGPQPSAVKLVRMK